ncbi:MAG: CBS domain-containing protein [Dehalococcoidia bacterium]
MSTVRDVLNGKSGKVETISPKVTIYEALEKMAQKDIGALVVMENKKVVGIVSERDYARKIILKGKNSKKTLVKEIMTSKLVSTNPNASVEEAMVLMTGKHVRHLPVFEKSKFVGIISIGDVMKSIVSNKDFLIDQLSDYISGKYIT